MLHLTQTCKYKSECFFCVCLCVQLALYADVAVKTCKKRCFCVATEIWRKYRYLHLLENKTIGLASFVTLVLIMLCASLPSNMAVDFNYSNFQNPPLGTLSNICKMILTCHDARQVCEMVQCDC